uniref:Uncharacterized protein n=1 Tax=Oryza brachyantha TaxID=4533 RepID=J3N5L5_ORYBR
MDHYSTFYLALFSEVKIYSFYRLSIKFVVSRILAKYTSFACHKLFLLPCSAISLCI